LAKQWRMVNNEVKQMVQRKNMFLNQIRKVYSYVQENQYEELNVDYLNVYHDFDYNLFHKQNLVVEQITDDLQLTIPKKIL
jgi:hypothetical protein